MNTITIAQIEPTTLCNLECGFCSGRTMKQGKMMLEKFIYTLDQMPLLTDLELQGEGEPLVHPHFFDMVDVAKERGIDVSIVSNGSFFTRENIDKILNQGIVRIDCSIDSADPAIFRKIRGFDLTKLIDGLDLLITEKKKRNLSYPVIGIFCIVMKDNIHSMTDVIDLYKKLGLEGGINFQPLQSMENYTVHYTDYMKGQLISPEEFKDFTRRISENLLFQQIQTECKKNGFHVKLFQNVRKFYGNRFRACHWLSKAIFINFEGHILPCSQIKVTELYSMGKIGSTSETEILAKKKELSQMLEEGIIPECCSGCSTAISIAADK